MLTSSLMFWLLLKAATLLLAFFGIGMYFRGIWIYFRVRQWLWGPARQALRRRYRSSVIAAVLREPELLVAKRQILLAFAGLPLFALGGAAFNALH